MHDEPPNLVQDEHGNVLFQPAAAMDTLNSNWDSVYSANTLHEHPLKMLEVIWPHVQRPSSPGQPS